MPAHAAQTDALTALGVGLFSNALQTQGAKGVDRPFEVADGSPNVFRPFDCTMNSLNQLAPKRQEKPRHETADGTRSRF